MYLAKESFIMMKRTLSIVTIFALLAVAMPRAADFDVYAAASTNINKKSVCYTPADDYRSGDCILTATKVMIRRASILRGSTKWSKISNKTLRKSATIWGLLLHRFNFEADGLSYKVKVGFFKKTSSEKTRLKEFKKLIKAHPEGVVVWGSNSSIFGMHGVLLTDVKDDIPYVMDSAYNLGKVKKGILKWEDSSMIAMTKCTQYWCITEVGLAKKAKAPEKGKPLAPLSASEENVDTESMLAIRGQSIPTTIEQGDGFGVAGVISSNYRISKVKLTISDQTGAAVISKTVKPGVWNFDLEDIDKDIKFGTLVPGTYTYTITAKDEIKSATLVSSEFDVTEKVTAPLAISKYSVPETIKEGSTFSVKGKITSGNIITKVTVKVLDASGNVKLSASAKPNKKSYNISGLDAKLKFGTLAKGSYRYKVIATDTVGRATLVNTKFTVN